MRRKHFQIGIGVTLLFSVVLVLQLFAAQERTIRFAHERRHPSTDAFRPIIGGSGRIPPVPLLIVALSDERLQLADEQKARLRRALPLPPKAPCQDATPSLIAPIRSLQAEEWTLIRDVLSPQQLKIFLHRLASMRMFRMLQMKLQTLLFSASLPTIQHITQIGDASAAIPALNLLLLLSLSAPLPQYLRGVSGKTRFRQLCVLRI